MKGGVKMENKFKIGDRVRVIDKSHERCGEEFDVADMDINDGTVKLNKDNSDYIWLFEWRLGKIDELIAPNTVNKMERKVMKVLVMNKKTQKVEKDVTVIADTEQQAVLKAFGVNTEDLFIRIEEIGKFEEEKRVNAVIVKEEKAAKKD